MALQSSRVCRLCACVASTAEQRLRAFTCAELNSHSFLPDNCTLQHARGEPAAIAASLRRQQELEAGRHTRQLLLQAR